MSHEAWLEQCQSDLDAAKVLSAANHHSQAVWFAAQAVEKGLKAILAALGLQYEDRHYKYLGHNASEILRLLPEALQLPTDPQLAAKVTTLESGSRGSRYPQPKGNNGQFVAPAVQITASQQEVADAEFLIAWCRERVSRALRARTAMTP
jgi:HEPN domain-containing protein